MHRTRANLRIGSRYVKSRPNLESARRRHPVRRLPRRHRPVLGQRRGRARPRPLRRHVPDHRLRGDDRLPPPAHPSLVRDEQARRVPLRRHGLDVGPGPRDLVGLRPSQAPRARRRGGRSAQPARRWRRGPARPHPRALRVAHQRAGPRAQAQVRRRPDGGPRHAARQPRLPVARRPRPRAARAGRLPHHRPAHRRPHRPAVGRPGARLLHPPRDVVDQLRLPLLRAPALRHRGPLDQRLLARAADPRRGLAPQPPRLPALGRPRPRPSRARSVRLGHPRDGARRPRVERRAHRARAPGAEADRAGRARRGDRRRARTTASRRRSASSAASTVV